MPVTKQSARIFRYILPSADDFVFIFIMYFALLLGPRFLGDGDPGKHILIGVNEIQHRAVLTENLFSFTELDRSLTTTEWLSQVIYALAYLAAGWNGVVLLAALLVAATFTLVFRSMVKSGSSYSIAAALVIVAILATLFHWLARPHLFTWLFLALWFPAMLDLSQGKPRSLWIFPLLMLLWVNLHGGYVIGLLICAAFITGAIIDALRSRTKAKWDTLMKLVIVGVFSFAVTLINPSGVALWTNVLGHVGNPGLMNRQIDWSSPDFHSANTWPFLFFILMTLTILTVSTRKLPIAQLFILLGLMALGLYSVRNVPFVFIACLAMITWLLQPLVQQIWYISKIDQVIMESQSRLNSGLWSLLAVLTFTAILFTGRTLDVYGIGNKFNPEKFPVQAIDWISEHPQSGNLFNEFSWGGYVLYRLWPDYRVFIDGQTDFYGPELVDEYIQIESMSGNWRELLEEYDIHWIIMSPESHIAHISEFDPRWKILYQDQVAIILRLSDP